MYLTPDVGDILTREFFYSIDTFLQESKGCFMSEEEVQSRCLEIFGESSFTANDVKRLTIEGKSVYQIKLRVLPFLEGMLYLVPDEKEEAWTLIDAGGGDSTSNADFEKGIEIIRAKYDASFRLDQIARVFLTHAHVDHFGGVARLKQMAGCEVCAHVLESRLIESYDECACVENNRYRFFLRESGVPLEMVEPILLGFGFLPGRVESVFVERKLLGGEKVGNGTCIYLPGHSSGHLCLLYDDVIFSGDLLLSKTLTQIWPAHVIPQTGVINYVSSLLKLKKLAVVHEQKTGRKLVALPAHEEPVFDIPKRIDAIFRAMERRNKRLLRLLEEESPSSIWDLITKMYWSGRPNREFFALCDVASRIEYLLQLNLVSVENYARLSTEEPCLRYSTSLTNTESAKNTIEQVIRMNLAGDESYLI